MATLGQDDETNQPITLGDTERRSGLYILGKPGMGKSSLLVNLMDQDIQHNHGLFFLDPHGDAIIDLLKRSSHDSVAHLLDYGLLLNPENDTLSFGINLLACKNISSLKERTDTYTRAYSVFYKLWEDSWGPWLQLIIQNTLYIFIENQAYTLAEVPLFLTNAAFRNHLISNVKYNREVAEFWQYEFGEKRERDQQEQVQSALTRVRTLLNHQYVRDIVGQHKTTIDFARIMEEKRILFVLLSATLASDIKKFIGTILISELLHAVRNRPVDKRHHFCILVDEFQHFSSSEDFSILINEARKFGIATTIVHQERYGQFADNKKMLGATAAAANKIFFQLTVKDSQELAPEFAEPPPTETRLEQELMISQNPVADLLRGHANPQIRQFVDRYIRPRLQERLEHVKETMEGEQLMREYLRDQAALPRLDIQLKKLSTSPEATAALTSALGHSQKLLSLFEISKDLRQTLSDFNKFFTAIMEGRIVPGQEAFNQFLISRVHDSSYVTQRYAKVLELYISLLYGDVKKPRAIPFNLANTYRLFPQTISAIQQQAEEKIKQEKEAYLEKAWDSYQYRYSLYRDEVERRELPEKDKKKHAIERLLNVRVELKYFSGLFEEKHLLKMYIPLLEYPSLQQALKPYFTACFASPWSDGIPKASELIPKILEQVKYLRSMRVYFLKEKQKKHREYLQREFNIWLPKPSPSFSFFEKKRLNQSDYGPFFEINLLDSFKEFLNQYKDKAIMVLVLISSVFNPLYWVHFDNYPSGEDKWSPKYNMLYLPTLVNREPLEILLLLERIATILSGVNVETDCGKYYWLAEAGNPYYERKHNRKRLERYGFCMSEFESMLVMIPEVKGLFNRKLLEYRDDVQFLRKQLEQHPRQRALYALAQNQELVITYLQCRACDIVLYGEKLADRTFPQPTIKDATSKQVADMVTWMVTILQEFEQQKERKKEEEEKKWQAITIKELQQQFDEHFSNKIIPMPDTLPPRILSDNEREKLINICLNEFSRSGDGNIKVVLAVIDEFVKFCALLNKPENHIKVPSRQYVEKQVNTRAFADMTHEMSQKLAGLPRFSAWAKVLQEQKGEQTVLKRKMKTLPMPPLLDPSDKIFTMLLDYLMNPATYTGVVKKRSEIEEEIRQRQEKWRDRAPEEPPPTHSAKTSKEPPVSEEEKFPDKTAEKERKEENKQEKLASLTALKEALASIPSRKGKEKLPTATVTKPDHITLPAIKSIHGWSAPQVQELQKQTVQALNMKVDFRDNLKGGGQGPLMVVILAGRFQMGSPDTELGRKKDERQHEVEIAPFAMGKYPVTFEEYDRFTEVTRRKKPSDEGWGRGRRPVINVSWFDAVAFTGWLSEQTGQTYRLPTEAEWEYACRAGTTTPFYFGETISTDQANYNGNYAYGNGLKGILRGKTVEVGQFPANAWGLHDMHGNVYEWTDSVYDKRYEGGEQRCARLDRDGFSVLRGGSFLSNPQVVRCAARAPYVSDTRYYGYGFRVVVSPFFSGR